MNKKTSLYIAITFVILVAGAAVFFGVFAINRESTLGVENTDSPNRFSLEYRNDAYGFSFHYPEDFKITEFSDEKGDVVLAEGEAGKSFQIFIQVFDEEGPLTPERIQQDTQGIVMKNARLYALDEVPAVVFEQEEPSFGSTFEMWFVYPSSPMPHGNYLYQITAKLEDAKVVKEILNTWEFKL